MITGKGILAYVLLKNAVACYNIRNVSFLKNLVRYLANNTGSLVSAKTSAIILNHNVLPLVPTWCLVILTIFVRHIL
jgi:uncharacterized protein